MWNQLLPLHKLVYKCLKVVLTVLIVNSVVSKLNRFAMTELEIMSVSFLGIKQ